MPVITSAETVNGEESTGKEYSNNIIEEGLNYDKRNAGGRE